jgi:hypothetical protein
MVRMVFDGMVDRPSMRSTLGTCFNVDARYALRLAQSEAKRGDDLGQAAQGRKRQSATAEEEADAHIAWMDSGRRRRGVISRGGL